MIIDIPNYCIVYHMGTIKFNNRLISSYIFEEEFLEMQNFFETSIQFIWDLWKPGDTYNMLFRKLNEYQPENPSYFSGNYYGL